MKSALQMGWEVEKEAKPMGFKAPKEPKRGKLKPVHVDGESHLVTIAPTGKGKGRSVIIPTLLRYPGAVVVLDPKGEAAATTARQREKFGKTVIIDPYQKVTKKTDCFNPLDIMEKLEGGNSEKAMMLTELLNTDRQGPSVNNDIFWDNRSNALISGVLTHILSLPKREDRHFGTLRKFLSADDIVYQLAKLLDEEGETMEAYAKEEISQFLQTADITRSCILTTAQQHIRIFGDEMVNKSITGSTSFDIDAFLRGEAMTIYLVLPPSKLVSHAPLLRLWIATLINLTMERSKRPKIPTLFMIDEAAQIGSLDSLRTATTLMRGYGLRVWTFWQDLSQLKRLYQYDWQTMLNNVDAIQLFGVTTWLMAKELSDILGNISPNELLKIDQRKMLVNYSGGKMDYIQKMDYLKDGIFKGKFDPHPMYNR